jgi:hypothetical protein
MPRHSTKKDADSSNSSVMKKDKRHLRKHDAAVQHHRHGSSSDTDSDRRKQHRRSSSRRPAKSDRHRKHRSDSSSASRSPSVSAKHVHRRRKDIEIRRFNGRDDVEEYLVQFELASRHNGWNDKEQTTALLCALDGPARGILADFDDPSTASYSRIKRALKKRFCSTDIVDVHEKALSQLRFTKGQNIRELSQDIARLTRKAYPEISSAQRERFAIKGLIHALHDKDAVFYIRDKAPQTLDEACTFFERFEALSCTDNKHTASARTISAAVVDSFQPEVAHDIAQLKVDTREQFRQLSSAVDQLSQSVSRLSTTTTTAPFLAPVQHQPTRDGSIPFKPCPQCHLTGHWKRDCPQLKSNATYGRKDTHIRCMECQEYGHRWRQCPRLQPGNDGGSTSAPNSRSVEPASRH